MNIDDEVRALGSIPLLRGVGPAQLRLIAFSGSRLEVPEGEALFFQGDVPDAVYVVLDGVAAVEVETPDGPKVVAKIQRDSLVGEMGVLTNEPRSATIRAEKRLVTLRLDRELFLGLLDDAPSLSRSVMRDLACRLQETTAQLVRQSA
ncbi:MAG TPA: cyclic nucleotide-binding domain-containing protein [Xanthobacteraceae bacterium]|nr:cyclic nucleotide-binding domain-containing protein [Xanthobacteraceae bacterium]